MSEKKLDVTKTYRFELRKIKDKLDDLEKGRIYEITKYGQDGYLNTNIVKLKEMLNDLLYKIEYSEQSDEERLSQAFKKTQI
ncbi:hypothetical protein NSQ55_21340 [Paenibacillus sp. FSL H7-0943]|uniref:hypothetical protein n=1 Tax=Paenibacillus sp. FSL H7-0943 TaxID=2954739 RepID=UPI0030CF9DC9